MKAFLLFLILGSAALAHSWSLPMISSDGKTETPSPSELDLRPNPSPTGGSVGDCLAENRSSDSLGKPL